MTVNNFYCSWIWEHSDEQLTFQSWMSNRPNEKEHNLDDCTLMDCENHSCDWIDVSCTDNYENGHSTSFICQKSRNEVVTTKNPITTTTHIFPGSFFILLQWNDYNGLSFAIKCIP